MPDEDYDAHFFDDPIPLLRKASLYLPNNTYEDPAPASPALNALADGSDYAAMNRQVWPANAVNTGIDLKEGPVRKYELTPVTRVGHQAYFLPWHGSGCATEMTLPDPPAANYFFTSALAGCSVIVTNTVQNPTIYHCGIESHNWGDGGRPDKPADVPAFWRDMVNHIEGARAGGARAIIGEVNTELYIKDPAQTYHHPSDGKRVQSVTTEDAIDCMTNMIHDDYVTLVPPGSNKRVRGGEAYPWGVFFGYYTGGRWNFYLQQNLVIKHDGRHLKGILKARRRRKNPVLAHGFSQSLPWRIRHVHVVPLAVGVNPVFTARDWDWDDVKDGNLWLP